MQVNRVDSPADLAKLSYEELDELAAELRNLIVETVSRTGGHLGSNLGAVELTLALHRVFNSPHDAIIFDTGHQAYVHKILTGRRDRFSTLRQEGGLSGYPSRAESQHDWVENSHASTALSWAYGLATAFEQEERAGGARRNIVAVVGDGALTGGMAYEALNNLGHAGKRVIIVLNDNGRSYAPTISKLSEQLTRLRLHPSYTMARERLRRLLKEIPAVGDIAYSGVHSLTMALREAITPHTFFESLGVRYAGPIDGHNIEEMEQAFRHAMAWPGPICVHVLTTKGKGYAPAEEDDIQRLHDMKVQSSTVIPSVEGAAPTTYTDAFTVAICEAAEANPKVVTITAAMPGPCGLLPFQAQFPARFFDVGIAEAHAVTAAAGMAMGGLRPVVALYATFFSRAFDQAHLDVGLHGLPVVFAIDRAGITGDDGPSHHGLVDMALGLRIPNMTIFAPSSAEEVPVMLKEALSLPGPSMIRYPKTPARHAPQGKVGSGLQARLVRRGDGAICVLAVGKMVAVAEEAAELAEKSGIEVTVWDVRVVRPPDPAMLEDAASHQRVLTIEDGVREGGAGAFLLSALNNWCQVNHLTMPISRTEGLPTEFIPHGKPDAILSRFGLDAHGLAESIKEMVHGEDALISSNGSVRAMVVGTAGELRDDLPRGDTIQER